MLDHNRDSRTTLSTIIVDKHDEKSDFTHCKNEDADRLLFQISTRIATELRQNTRLNKTDVTFLNIVSTEISFVRVLLSKIDHEKGDFVPEHFGFHDHIKNIKTWFELNSADESTTNLSIFKFTKISVYLNAMIESYYKEILKPRPKRFFIF